jgi:hypothetical protein
MAILLGDGEDLLDRRPKKAGEFEGGQDGRVEFPELDGVYRLPADADRGSEIFLGDFLDGSQNAEIVAEVHFSIQEYNVA